MNNKKLIAICTNHEDDIYCFRKELIETLVNNGYNVLISCPYGEKLELMNHIRYVYDNPVIDRRGTNIVNDYKLFRHYKKLFKKYRPAVVLTFTAKPNVYGGLACRKLKIPYIPSITGLGTAIENGGVLSKILLFLYRKALKKADKVFFQNADNKDLFIKHNIVKGAYEIVPGSGVNLSTNTLEDYPTHSNALMFITIGRIMKDKGIGELLDAAKILKQKHPDIRFKLVGGFDENYKGKVTKAEQEGIIEYLGVSNNIHDLIKTSHATIHPSYHEGMSNVLLESAACGRPVIASDVHGCRETFDDGVSGIAFKPKSVDALVEAVEKFINLPYEEKKKMGLAGRKKVEKEFDRQIVVDAYLDGIKRIGDKQNGAL